MKRATPHWLLLAPFFDFIAAFTGYFLARAIRPITDGIPFLHSYFDPRFVPEIDFFLPFVSITAIVFVISMAIMRAYCDISKLPLWQMSLGTIIWSLLLIAYFSIVRKEVIFSRIMLLQAMVFSLILAIFGRFIIQKLHRIYGEKRRITLFGDKSVLRKWQKMLAENTDYLIVQAVSKVSELSKRKKMDELWLLNSLPDQEANSIASWCAEKHIILCWRSQWQMGMANVQLQLVEGLPLLRAEQTPLDGWGRIIKRLIDISIAVILLILLMPCFLIFSILIKLDSQGNIFYASKRVGRSGQKFSMYKFRSMVVNADQLKTKLKKHNHRQDGPFFKIKNDPRVTGIGCFLRRWSIDELPQLWNVLKGDMSIIGPRPHLPEEIAEFTPNLKRILSIKPGISGLAQVSGRSDLEFEQEMQLDLYYLQHWSLVLDAVIFLKSILVVVGGRGAD